MPPTAPQDARAVLEQVLPFAFLPAGRRIEVAKAMRRRTYGSGQVIFSQGDDGTRDVLLLSQGHVIRRQRGLHARALPSVVGPAYFGERPALFDHPREYSARAEGPVTLHHLPADLFLDLVETEPVFAQALANVLKGKHGIFDNYRQLLTQLLASMDGRQFFLSRILPAYHALHPALHPGLDEARLDTAALGYAVARLPRNVTTTNFYFLTRELSSLYRDPDDKFDPIPAGARRRAVWQLLPGKDLILLRDAVTDVVDLVTTLCVYAVEARKIRHRIGTPWILREMRTLAKEPDPEREALLLESLGLTDEEVEGLRRIWPSDLPARLRDILLHHEDIAMQYEPARDDYTASASERWVAQIRDHVRRLVDLEDPALHVHIISSNIHSVANCLSAHLAERKEEVLAWGERHHPGLAGEPSQERPWGHGWANREDLLYATSRLWLEEAPGARDAWAREDAAHGHHRLDTTAFTGIEVDLFDLASVDPDRVDPAVPALVPDHPALIVNVDYAFGQQAENILSNLLFLFGRRVRSVSVLGKAGGLVGNRGDLLLARDTLLQTNDELYALPNADLDAALLHRLVPERDVHEGPMLTVAGTLLQDRTLLWLYRRVWGCIGLEMEGSYYARQLLTAIETGAVSRDVRTRFVYYTSDIPLRGGESLATSLAPWEGVPPLYGSTRAVLTRIYEQEAKGGA